MKVKKKNSEFLPFMKDERYENLISQCKTNPQLVEDLNPIERVKFGRYLERRNEALGVNQNVRD